jgi:hypothetical protein
MALVCLLVCMATAAQADRRDRARRIFDRIVGAPPSEAQLDDMVARLGPGPADPSPAQLLDATQVALADPDFYNVSLVDFAAPWTNQEQTVYTDLNDYTLTVIGMIRDGAELGDAVDLARRGHRGDVGIEGGVGHDQRRVLVGNVLPQSSLGNSPAVLDPLTAFAALPGF